MAEDKPRVEISIEASQKTGAISATATELEKLERKMTLTQIEATKMNESMDGATSATSQLGTAIASFVSVAAIAAFFKEAVEESLKEAEALRVLRGSLESTGSSWTQYGEIVEEFGKKQQAQTRFDDTVTYEVLGKLARSTSSVGEAMRATALAQNLSVASGVPLAQTTEIINSLLLGQERAVKMATKEFGSYAAGATTAQQALENLERSTMGAAKADDSATKSFAQLKASIGDMVQMVGDIAVPELVEMAVAVTGLMRSTLEYIGVLDKKKAAQAEGSKALAEEVELLRQAADKASLFTDASARNIAKLDEAKRAYEEKNKELERTIALEKESGKSDNDKLTAQEGIEASRDKATQILEIETALSESVKALTLDEFDLKKIKSEERLALAIQLGADEALAVQAYNLEQDAADNARKVKAEKDKEAASKKDKLQKQKDKEFLVQYLNEVGALSSAKNKELAAIGKAASIAAATISGFEAAAHSFKFGARFGGPILGAAMAALSLTATGAHIASIAGVPLATGGVVPGTQSGVQATIGERGRSEAVLPLESPRAMGMVGKAIADAGGTGGGGATVINLYLVMPGLEAVRDPRVAREILEVLGDAMAGNMPEARTTAVRIMDLAELNSRRSA